MSISNTHKHLILALCCAALATATGCGSEPLAPAPAQAPSTTAEVTGDGATPASSGTASPAEQTSEANLVPVEIELKDGRFAPGTPRTVHVPSDFLVLITARTDSEGPYQLSVISPSTAQTFKIPSGETQRITQDGLAPGGVIKLMLGKQTVKVVADAEPGP